MLEKSISLLKKAEQVIPGGVNSPVRAFGGVGGNPRFFKSGTGPYLFDEDDNRYIDYVGSWGPMILGHNHPQVLQAITDSIPKGLSFGAPTKIEIDIANLIIKHIPSIEMIRMVNSGTEATLSAIRLARGFTNRSKIIKFQGCYHGHSDSLLVKAGSGMLTFAIPDSNGVPKATANNTLVAPYNDLKTTQALFEKYANDIAAVIVEPIAGNMNLVFPQEGFLPGLRALCDQAKALLIFDEVITGFRVSLGGAQDFYNITPDLTCLGKIIGGGLPVGAFGGKKDIMRHLAPLGPVYQAGTLSGNPIAMAAGLATLKEISKINFYQNLSKTCQALVSGLRDLAKSYKIPFAAKSIGGLFGFQFTQDPEHALFKNFFHKMLDGGVYFAPSAFESGFISSAHSQVEVNATLELADKCLKS